MSLDTLLTQTVTLVRAGSTTNRYGDAEKNWATATRTTAKGWVSQQSHAEDRDQREAQVSGWVLFLAADADVTGLDRVELNDLTFEVDGPPLPAYRPQGLHHYEVPLRRVEG